MHIIIADDTADARQYFSDRIKKCGHVAIPLATLDHLLEYLRKPENPADVLYLDNHFHADHRTGISCISQVRQLRPSLVIVATSVRPIEPLLIEELLESKAGFLHKPTDNHRRLEADINQRVSQIVLESDRERRLLEQIRQDARSGKEGVASLLSFLGLKKQLQWTIKDLRDENMELVFPKFTSVEQVQIGQKRKLVKKYSVSSELEFKATTAFAVGLGIEDSASFFGTKIGGELKAKLKTELEATAAVSREQSVAETIEVTLTEEEIAQGIRMRDYLAGDLHKVYSAEITPERFSELFASSIRIYLFAPLRTVYCSRAYDLGGKLVEDGAASFPTYENHWARRHRGGS